MRTKMVAFIFALMVFLGVSVDAQAFVITMDFDQLISQGDVIQDSFNINPLLSGSEYNNPYDITSASLTFGFFDDQDPSSLTSNSTGPYVLTWDGWDDDYERDVYQTWTDPAEIAMINVVDQNLIAATDYDSTGYGSATKNLDNVYTYKECHYYFCYTHYEYYYSNIYQQNDGYWGQETVLTSLSSSSLDDLALDGILDFTVSGQTGDIIFDYAQLDFEANENPNVTPEPATLMLFLSGLFGLGFFRKK